MPQGQKIISEKLIGEENVIRLEKGKRSLLQVLFGRTAIIMLILLIQVGFFFYMYRRMQEYVTFAWVSNVAISIIIVIYLLNRSEDPTVKLTWVILIMAAPVFGTILYVWIRNDIGHRILHKRLDTVLDSTKDLINTDPLLLEKLKREEKGIFNLMHYMRTCGSFPVFENPYIKYYSSGEDTFEDLLFELEMAKDFIFMEFFIIEEGYMWGRVLDILQKKVREGVEVRVLYDGTCALMRLPYNYPKKLHGLGIKCKMFAPAMPFVSTHYNNRDHRKIVVIDGHTAFTGGFNLADEYINKKNLYGHWKDTGIKIKGEASKSFTLMFLQMWNVNDRAENYGKYLDRDFRAMPAAKGYALPYADSPLDQERCGEMIYYDILNRAKDYVHIMSPYLILDNELITALTFAAKRGVEVQIILPHKPDKEYAFALAKTHYRQLIQAGVEIYEYLPGFVHAKAFISDDRKAAVGTINLDYRSLYHHFECGLYMYKATVIPTIEKDFQETLTKCKKITLDDLLKENLLRKLIGVMLKVVAPLM